MAKFELGQKLNRKWMGLTVPIIITKRVKVEDLDSGEIEIYYDYKHDLSNGSTFTKVSEEYLNKMYMEALEEYIHNLVNKSEGEKS